MKLISRKQLVFIGIVGFLLIGGVFWYSVNKKQESQIVSRATSTIDADIAHWQIKETKYFTVKFPKEWFWLETNFEKTEYNSGIITNNPDFDIDKYPDVSIFTGGNYPLDIVNNTLVITTNGLGWPTSNSGTPKDSIDWHIEHTKKDINPNATCDVIGNVGEVPLEAYCSFVDDNHQKVQTYFIAYSDTTFAFTARTKENNVIVNKDILTKIARNMKPKTGSVH